MPTPSPSPSPSPSRRRWARAAKVRAWTLLPLLAVIVIALVLGLPMARYPWVAQRGVADFAAGRYEQAADRFASQHGPFTPVPWQADFNEGTALLATVDPATLATDPDVDFLALMDASILLASAADKAQSTSQPPEVLCMVSTNAAISFERLATWGDADAERLREQAWDAQDATEADDLDTQADDAYLAAADSWDRAASFRAAAGCDAAGRPQQQDHNDEAAGEDQGKAEESRANAGEETADPNQQEAGDAEADPEADPAEQQRQEQLGQRNQDGSRAADEERQSQTSDGAGDLGSTERGW